MPTLSVQNIRRIGLIAADQLIMLAPRSAARAGVAIIRVDAIGDFTLWLDAALALVKHYQAKGERVTLIANSTWAGFAAELHIFDEVISVDRKRFSREFLYRSATARRLRDASFSKAIQPTYSRDLIGDVLMRFSRADERIGSVGDSSNLQPWESCIGQRWYTRLIGVHPGPRMEIIRNAEFVRGLTNDDYKAGVANLRPLGRLPLDPRFTNEVSKYENFYVLFPGASWSGKQWATSSFADLAERLYARTGWCGVVCGSAIDERTSSASLCRKAHVPLLNWAGRTSLLELGTILAHASLLVSNDTSAVHLGATVGTPTICILGGGHEKRFLPYEVERTDERPLPLVAVKPMACFGCNWRCIYNIPKELPMPCIAQITVDDVWGLVESLLLSASIPPT